MKWEDFKTTHLEGIKKTLVSPPPVRPPPPKHPLFTTDVMSTKSFGPGHILGAGILVGGLFLVTRHFVRKSQAATGRLDDARTVPPGPPVEEPKVASFNQRGQYGKRP